ncbi:MAG: glycoside hydrolase family 43 protein [Bacteroidales bacterium]
MKLRVVHVLFLILTVLSSYSQQITIPSGSGNVAIGDPFIMLWGGKYYAYGTKSPLGIVVYISDDLVTWTVPGNSNGGLALHKDDVWAERRFWAPEVYYVKGRFYMFYSADEHVCVATSDNPAGPFRQSVQEPLIAEEKCIDNSLFIDEDGKAYMQFCRFNDGNNVWIAEMEDDLLHIRKETMHKCINVSQKWEEIWPRVNEGSFIIKHGGIYYMTYSANSYESPFYGVGYATSKSIYGPWVKYQNNPILQKPGGLPGVGHSALFIDKDGKLRIVFHSHFNSTSVHPRIMHIGTVHFEMRNGGEIMTIGTDYLTPELK